MAPHRATRLRAWSNTVLRRSPSPNDKSSAGPVQSLATAGLGLIISPKEEEERAQQILNGAVSIVAELERVASLNTGEPAEPGEPGKLLRRMTFELADDKELEQADHPIHGAVENPFDGDESDGEFEEDIFVITNETKFFMRAILDTGMDFNAMSREKAEKTGLKILPYSGGRIHDADGPPVIPRGQIDAQFHFGGHFQTAQTWTVPFVILESPPFDVALGKRFLKMSRLIQKNTMAFTVVVEKPTKEDEAAIEKSKVLVAEEVKASKLATETEMDRRRRKKNEKAKQNKETSGR